MNRVAKDLFKGSLEVAEFNHLGEGHDIVSINQRHHQVHRANPAKIIWGERLNESEGIGIYDSVLVDGVTYQVNCPILIPPFRDIHLQMGDIVMVEPDGKVLKKTPDAQTVNKYGNRWW